MQIKVSRGVLCQYIVETDCEGCELIARLANTMKVSRVDVVGKMFECGLLELVEKHLQKET